MRIGPYVLLESERVVLFGDRVVVIAPKAVDVLHVLAVDAGRIVSKAELMERVWPESFVDEANLTQNIYVLRRRFGRDASGVRIENVPKRGYRLIVPVAPELHASRVCPLPPPVGRRWLRAAAVCAAVLVGCAMPGSSLREGSDGVSPAMPVAALRDYLLARVEQVGGTRAAVERAARLFGAVVRAAPESALGYAGRAETEASLAYYANDAAGRSDLQARAITDARTAVAKGNNAADADAALGAIEMSIEHDDAAAAQALSRALTANPNHVGALVWNGTLLMHEGRIDEARETFARAVAIAPNAAGTVASLAWTDFLAGDFPDAIALSKQMLAAHQFPVVARVTLANAYLAERDYGDARLAIARLWGEPDTRIQAVALTAQLNASKGRTRLAAQQLGRLGARVDPRQVGDWDAASIAAAYVALGDHSRAYLWLARVALWGRRETARDPRFAALTHEPRFGTWMSQG